MEGTATSEQIGAPGPGGLGPIDTLDDLLRAIDLLERVHAHVAVATGRLDAAGAWGVDGATSMPAWLRHHARLGDTDASALVRLGRFLHRFPAVADAATSRLLSTGQVHAWRKAVTEPVAPFFERQQAALVRVAAHLDVAGTERVAQHWRARAEALADLPEPTVPERSMTTRKASDGSLLGSFVLDPEGRVQFEQALRTAMTWDGPGDERTPTRQRGDAFVDILTFFNNHVDAGSAVKNRPHIELLLPVDQLAQVAKHVHTHDGTLLPAGDTAAHLCDCTIARVVHNGSEILDYGRSERLVPRSLRRALALRDGGCRWTTCDRPEGWCDAHHLVPWEAGGRTDLDSTGLFCSHHHHVIHRDGWRIELLADGTMIFTHPDGRQLRSTPRGSLPAAGAPSEPWGDELPGLASSGIGPPPPDLPPPAQRRSHHPPAA